jgi:hypothetical protein
VQPYQKEGPFDWISSGRDELADAQHPNWTGNFVSHLMPTMFEAYAKILHRIEASYENIDKPLSHDEMAILNIPPCAELKSLVESRRNDPKSPRVSWRELAETLNVPFTSEINLEWYAKKLEQGCWPRFLCGPDEGLLSRDECAQLVSVLETFTKNGECFLRFAEMPFITTGKPLLFHGVLHELGAFLKEKAYQITPEYWWPPNNDWCVCSDYDLKFTVVGGSRELIANLLKNDVLECLEVQSHTRIDYLAPMP